MRQTLLKIKDSLKRRFSDADDFDEADQPQNYLELDTHKEGPQGQDSKIVVRTFTIEDFQDIKPVLDSIREGYTIGLINIRPIRDKDVIELKRTVNKLKKTIEAIDGDIAGFGDDWIVVTPQFAKVYRASDAAKQNPSDDDEFAGL